MDIAILDNRDPTWNGEIDRAGAALGAPDNPHLFPYHFLQVVLPRLGGKMVVVKNDGRRVGVGFLFPRGYRQEGGRPRRIYTLRYHAVEPLVPSQRDHLLAHLQAHLHGAEVVYYDPAHASCFSATGEAIGTINVGRPSRDEALGIRQLQQAVWGSPPEFLYPADIHSREFGLGTSLVARVEERLAGFLFGFYKFGGPALPADWHQRFGGDLRLESQTMAVLPEYRGMRIGHLLKRIQAEQAWANGIGIIHWTADPLQFPNAALNFGLLRAVAFDFYPDLYPFRNNLNRVPASRFGLTWLVGTERVRNVPRFGSRALILDLRHHPDVVRVNQGWEEVRLDVDAPLIAVEIPADWTGLQERSLEAARRWRETTDRLLAHYVGRQPGQYVITGVGTDQDRCFLIGEQVSDALWQHLGT